MIAWLLLGVTSSLVVTGGHSNKESDAFYNKVKDLYTKTSPDYFGCKLHIHKEKRKACYDAIPRQRRELMALVREGWLEKRYFRPVGENKCIGGFASFNIGVFDDPVELPCDEHAFDPPKHTPEEYRKMYLELKALWNEYDKMCVQFMVKANCEELKWNRGQKLALAIKKAEQEGLLPNKCKDGVGAYSFDQGMAETDMPCEPMPEGTTYKSLVNPKKPVNPVPPKYPSSTS